MWVSSPGLGCRAEAAPVVMYGHCMRYFVVKEGNAVLLVYC